MKRVSKKVGEVFGLGGRIGRIPFAIGMSVLIGLDVGLAYTRPFLYTAACEGFGGCVGGVLHWAILPVFTLFLLATILISRRCRDINLSGAFSLIFLAVALSWLMFMVVGEIESAQWFRYGIVALTVVLALIPGSRGANRFGDKADMRAEEAQSA